MCAVNMDMAVSKTPDPQARGGMTKPSSPTNKAHGEMTRPSPPPHKAHGEMTRHSSSPCVDFDSVCICPPLLSPQDVHSTKIAPI